MDKRFSSYISVISKDIPPALIGPDNLSEINEIAALFPAKASSFFGFESRLGEAAPRVDFLLHIQASEGGREILAGHDSENLLPENIQGNPVWKRVINFCKDWAEPSSDLHQKADNIWLEFDVARNGVSDPPVPSFFFRA